MSLGSSAHATITGTFSDGSQQDLTSKVTWSSDLSVAAILSGGVIQPNGMGQTVFSAALGQVTASSILTVVSTPKFAFVTGSTSDTIGIFSVDAKTSALTNVATKALAAGSAPLHVALHPTLPVLYVLDTTQVEAFPSHPTDLTEVWSSRRHRCRSEGHAVVCGWAGHAAVWAEHRTHPA